MQNTGNEKIAHGIIEKSISLDKTGIKGKVKQNENDNSEFLMQLREILSVLSKNDAMIIFRMSYDGIKSAIDTPAEIRLTKKQYYTRLKQLVELGLITKHNESYIQTTFGKVVYQKYIIDFINIIKNLKYLQMVDVLKSDPKFNDSDIIEFMSKIESHVSTDLQKHSVVRE